jgi:hypothetical protein
MKLAPSHSERAGCPGSPGSATDSVVATCRARHKPSPKTERRYNLMKREGLQNGSTQFLDKTVN